MRKIVLMVVAMMFSVASFAQTDVVGTYNEAVKAYNVAVRRFPSNIIASMFGFETKSMFEAQAGAEVAPVVQF